LHPATVADKPRSTLPSNSPTRRARKYNVHLIGAQISASRKPKTVLFSKTPCSASALMSEVRARQQSKRRHRIRRQNRFPVIIRPSFTSAHRRRIAYNAKS